MKKRPSTGVLLRVLACSIFACSVHADDRSADATPTATQYVEVNFEDTCDDNNKLLVLANRHEYKTIAVMLRWNAWKGETLTKEFFAIPNSITEIGCATSGEILQANFTNF